MIITQQLKTRLNRRINHLKHGPDIPWKTARILLEEAGGGKAIARELADKLICLPHVYQFLY